MISGDCVPEMIRGDARTMEGLSTRARIVRMPPELT
jgi:hypothetical protein